MMGRLLGVDPGTRRIGIALSDPQGRIASPHSVVEAGRTDVEAIVRLVQENDVERIVVGYPRRLDGTPGPAAEAAADLARRLESAAGVAVTLWDERLSSAQAERTLIAQGTRRRDRRGATDRIAAALILQNYIDAQTRPG